MWKSEGSPGVVWSGVLRVCVCVWPYLTNPHHELGPAPPLGALVPLQEGGLIGVPAAVLVVEPEAVQTHALLQVRHPVCRDVNETRQRTWRKGGHGQTYTCSIHT